MLKIRSRIALLYSLLTMISIVFCIVLFYFFLKFNIYKHPILSNFIFNDKKSVDTITSPKGKIATNEGKNSILMHLMNLGIP